MGFSRRTPPFSCLFILAMLFASPAMADCLAVRGVGSIETSVTSLLSAPDLEAARAASARLALAIDTLDSTESSADLSSYLAARRAALARIEGGDLEGAKRLLADPAIRSAAMRVASGGGDDCFEEASSTPEQPAVDATGAAAASASGGSGGGGTGDDASGDGRLGGELKLADSIGTARGIDWSAVSWSSVLNDGRFIAPLIGGLTLITFCGAIFALFSDRRREPRYLCYLPVEISSAGRKLATAMVDVNRTGARVVIEGEPVKPGDPVAISVDGRLRPAVVIWEKHGRAGVRFKEALGGRELRHIEAMARSGAGFEKV